MNPVFDVASGRVRLDPTTFEALCRQADPPSGPGGALASDSVALAALQRSGALVDGAVHEALRPALAAVTRSIASLQLVVTGSAGYQLHQGWLSVVSAVLADVGDGSYDFAALGTEFVPTLMARMTRLGLRPHLEPASVAVTEAVLDGLASHEADPRAEAAQAIVALTASVWPTWAAIRAGRTPPRGARHERRPVAGRRRRLGSAIGRGHPHRGVAPAQRGPAQRRRPVPRTGRSTGQPSLMSSVSGSAVPTTSRIAATISAATAGASPTGTCPLRSGSAPAPMT